MHRIEFISSALAAGVGATLTVAQLTPPDTSYADVFLKLGSVGVVAYLFWWFMKLHFKTIKELADSHRTTETEHSANARDAISSIIAGHREVVERIEKAHTDSANKFDIGAQKIVDAVHSNTSSVVEALDEQSRRCASTAQILSNLIPHKQ